MGRWSLKIELKSDFCTATGDNVPGMLNSKTALEYGIPYIPAKRIKGCLLKAGREMADNGIIKMDTLYRIFGRSGMEYAVGIHIGDGHLNSVPGYLFVQEKAGQIKVGDYERLQKTIKECSDIEDTLLEDIFTRKRTRTALAKESGIAKEHSLRTVQVVPSGIVFSSQLDGELSLDEEKVLLLCVKGLRHMGIGITRGMGEVRCSLEKVQYEKTNNIKENCSLFKKFSPEEEVTLSYEIELKAPVVMSDFQNDGPSQIPAAAISGAIAGLYIKKHSLGAKAHEDETFRRIFLRDGVQFGNAFFKKDGIEYVPAPKAFAIPKADGTSWFNIMADQENLRRKNISNQIFLQKNCLYLSSPEKEIHFHHGRPADRGSAHALNDRAVDTSAPTGQFFQYTALSKGQTFAGTWIGKVKDIQELVECLEENQYHLLLGKSKTAEYGKCRFRILWGTLSNEQDKHSVSGREWLVWLLSPFIYRNHRNGVYETESRPLLRQMSEMLGCNIELADSICGYTVMNGYNSKWRLPAVTIPALSAGSSFHIKTDRVVSSWEIEGRRWGMLTGKGCGQIKAVLWKDCMKGNLVTLPMPGQGNVQYREALYDDRDQFLAAILDYQKKRLVHQEAALLALDEIDGQNQLLPPSSAISLLIQILKEWDGGLSCYEKIKKEVERISGEEKRQRILEFIKPCEGKSYEFIKQYLEIAKWNARRGERG